MTDGESGRRLVDGRFELLARLGSGGMGTVWRARDIILHREVALKEVRPPDPTLVESDPAMARMQRERVLREARALARLSNPHVVTIHHIVDTADAPYPWIVMELVSGSSLYDRLREGPLTPQEAARIGRGVLSGLRAAHAAGVQHRDVKPANVLLRSDGSPVLTDFGIAALRDATSLTATGDLIGSPEYIAPERIRGDESRTASDLWSLGMMLYVALEGHHPMRRATTMATLVAVMSEPVPPPLRCGPLTPALTAVLVSDPDARPSAEELDHMLAAAEQASSASTRRDASPWPAPSLPGTHTPSTPYAPSAPVHDAPRADFRPTPPAWQPAADSAAPSQSGRGDEPPRRTRVTVRLGLACAVVGVTVAAAPFIRNGLGSHASAVEKPGGSGSPTSHPTGTVTPDAPAASTSGSGSGRKAGTPSGSLLTPAGVRSAVAELTPVMGGSKVVSFNVYPEYAGATAPTKADRRHFDTFDYRSGTATRSGPDPVSSIDAKKTLVDLKSVNWDALPALWKQAEKRLEVQGTGSRYIIVQGDIITGSPSVYLYLSDDYGGGGYLEANLQGRVTRVYASGS
ncbi:protein kinase [Streptomyces sp. NPDC006314]|uniref:serine/threonine-protein kinase n=1 Tax=Streptomyces sp. NPDC006314 TaxID=3154475 RepID=UPI0033BA2A1A